MDSNWIDYIYQLSITFFILSLVMFFILLLHKLYKFLDNLKKYNLKLSNPMVELNLTNEIIENKTLISQKSAAIELKNAFEYYQNRKEENLNIISKSLSLLSDLILNIETKEKNFKKFIQFIIQNENLSLTIENYDNYSIENLIYIENYFSTKKKIPVKKLFKTFAYENKTIHIEGDLSKSIFFPFLEKESSLNQLFLFSFLLKNKIPIILIFLGEKKFEIKDIQLIFNAIKKVKEI